MQLLLQILIISGVVALILLAMVLGYRTYYNCRARRFGYASRAAYIRAIPHTDEEKREAVDQALKGLVICFVGAVSFPFLMVGAFPLYIGGRKTFYSLMGLGRADEHDQSPRT